MERIWTTELPNRVGERVQLAGWLHRLRRHSRVSFLILRDARGLAQVVIEEPALVERLAELYNESVVSVEGVVAAEPQAPNGIEIREPKVSVVSAASAPPPIDLFRPTLQAQLPTILDYAPLALRHPRHRAIFQVASASMLGFRETLRSRGFVEIQTPKLVGSATESGANVFSMEYFGKTAYLAQSPQFYKQMLVGVFERVFEVGPVFRAEPHDTPRHLNQYTSLDLEFGFIQDHTTVMALLTEVLRGMQAAIERETPGALSILGINLPEVPATIPSVHFAEAQRLMHEATGEYTAHEPDLSPAQERWLGEWARRECNSDFLYVVGYPMVKRPFYTHPEPERPQYSNSFDLLFRGMEVVTGGQRLHRYEDYLQAIKSWGITEESLGGYLDAFKYGMPPHGGCALGLERWVARLVGADNIRETTLFPRDMQRLTP
ncbi:MAG: aspartate--tRNA(Asn) ligase [Chloroflexota bacterium]|nr:aspartate--tRNA(Asn) ligase [Chloroflexota bacterium]MDQ5865942.1 aspartate--tRNA(Asn) ligase [Chloroflexota bacterium]